MKRHLPLTGHLSEAWGCESLSRQHGQNKIKEGNGESREKSQHKAYLRTRTRAFSYQLWACGQTMRPREKIGAGKEHILKRLGFGQLSLILWPCTVPFKLFALMLTPSVCASTERETGFLRIPLCLIAPHFISAHS